MSKLSKVLSNFLAELEADPSKTTQAAARDARLKLEHEARTEACKTCEKAGWMATIQRSREGSYDELLFSLGKCGGGVILQSSESFGLMMPNAPFFCSSRSEDRDHGAGQVADGVATLVSVGGKAEGQGQNDGWPRQRRG